MSGVVVEPPVAEVQRFGGGPFWKRYGYGKWYQQDYEEETTSSALPALEPESQPVPSVKTVERAPLPVRYRALEIPHIDTDAIAQRIRDEFLDNLREGRRIAQDKARLLAERAEENRRKRKQRLLRMLTWYFEQDE